MKLSEVKQQLGNLENINFKLPNGSYVPASFHVTEVGMITKNFIDCGGTVRQEKVVNFQLWNSIDFYHRLAPERLLDIINLSEKVLNIEDLEIEVEYQADTIGKYGLGFDGKDFVLETKTTACLATDACGIPGAINEIKIKVVEMAESCCTPGGGCC